MADNQNEPPPGPPVSRRRAPTITIDTPTLSNENISTEPSQHADTLQQSDSPMAGDKISPTLGGADAQPPKLSVQTSFDSNRTRPVSPHNVSSPANSKGADRSSYLAVPGTMGDRKGSMDSESDSHAESTVLASNSTQSEQGKANKNENDKIMNDASALQPDVGTEAHFDVEDNPFAFSPGQLTKMFNPKSLAAFYKLGGMAGLEKGLRTDRHAGLSVDETHVSSRITFDEATDHTSKASPSVKAVPASGGDEPFKDRLRVFKDNRIPQKKGKSLLQLMWITFNDKVLILLSIAAVVSLAVGLYQTFGGTHKKNEPKVEWVEGVAIIVAIAIVVIVGSLNDYQKERQFAKLNKRKQDRSVKVVRSGRTVEISVYDILVGDVVHLEPGDLVPVDGVLIDGFNVKCDESQATGESDIIRKQPADAVYRAIENHETLKKMDPLIQSGARVMEGVGTFMVTSTGIYSSYGKTLMALNDDPEMTPLQAKLNVIATWIAKLGSAAGLLLFIVLFIKFLVALPKMGSDVTAEDKGQRFLNIFIVVVTIIVVAVPEGLPLAVTLALAFATTRMLKDNNLVRHLKACEVMGNATSICSDKTGTLTQNKMQVVSGTIGTDHRFGGAARPDTGDSNSSPVDESSNIAAQEFAAALSAPMKDLLEKSIALNSTAFEGDVDGVKTFIGSKTETALLLFAQTYLGLGPVMEVRASVNTLQLIPFDSGRKCMGIIVGLPQGGARMYIKGASEIILAKCARVVRDPATDTSVVSITKENTSTISNLIDTYAMRSLRTIGIAFRDFEAWPPKDMRRVEGSSTEMAFEDLFDDLSFIGMVGIQDPLREGVPQAVKACQMAGVTVRMVTGDNKLTAQAIAKECGILQPGGIVMEGPEFRNLSRLQQYDIIPRLQVLARSSPEDKRVLVRRLKDKDEIVAVTGDGTNDAPALKTADIGFSMGIAGTEVAKEASSIILMDDNFTSIVKALKWGRAVNDAVKRFLQFQLTVNITAVILTFITAVSSDKEESVLTAVQLLWVNLIMDTLAALALATDPPQDSILDRKPEPRHNFIITPTMWKMILGQAVYQLAITLVLYYGSPHGILPLPESEKPPSNAEISTLVFNTFVWMQIFNQWNNRRLDNRFNIFEGLTHNWFFIGISAIMCGGQVLIIFVGGAAFSIAKEGQSGTMWAIAIVLGFLSIPFGVVIRLIPDWCMSMLIPDFLKRRARKAPGLAISDEEMGMYPAPLADIRDELNFLRRMKGGRLNNLKFAIQHPKETILQHRSPSHSRSNSPMVPRTPLKDDKGGSGAATPDSRRRSKSVRSRSNSALGAPTVMAGIVAAGVAAGWSPVGRTPTEEQGGSFYNRSPDNGDSTGAERRE